MRHLTLLLNTGQEVLIDPEHVHLAGLLWYEKDSRGKRYAYNNALGFMHKHILKPRPGYVTSHENGDTFDNRLSSNLRERTVSYNKRNVCGAQRGSAHE